MANCILTSGYSLGCLDSVGGLRKIYGTTFQKDVTYTFDTDDHIIGLTGSGSTASYYQIEQEMETAEFKQPASVSENGQVFYTQNLSLAMPKVSSTRNLMVLLGQSRTSWILEFQDGTFYLMGANNGCKMTAGEINAGKAFGDLNGSIITLTSKDRYPAYQIDDISIFNII